MHKLVIVLLLVPLAIHASPVASLHRGLDTASQLLNIAGSKFFFLSSQINTLQQGLTNLRQARINDYQIATLEPAINRLTWKAQQAVSNPSYFDRLGVESLAIVDRLNTLGRILPANRSVFAAQFRRQGPYNMISQALTEIDAIVNAIEA